MELDRLIDEIKPDGDFDEELFLAILEIDDKIDRQTVTERVRRKCKEVNREAEFDRLLAVWNERNNELSHKPQVTCENGVFKPVKEIVPAELDVFSASQLVDMNLPELKTIVEDIIKVGVITLSAKSKMYKSWLCLQMAIAVTTGKRFLGKATNQCDVLYIDLENDKRISRDRLLKLLNGEAPPQNLFIVNDVPTMKNGFTVTMENFLNRNNNVHLIIIDVFAKIKYQKKSNQSDYDCDYQSIGELKTLAEKYDCAIILVMHNRKMVDDTDPFSNILGSSALMGASDESIVIYKQKRSDEESFISITGRTVESNDYTATFDKETCMWKLLGTTEQYQEDKRHSDYEKNPIVRTIKKLLEQGRGTWTGKVTEIINSSKYFGCTIYTNGSVTGREINKLRSDLCNFDFITVETSKKGSASAEYTFKTENPFNTV